MTQSHQSFHDLKFCTVFQKEKEVIYNFMTQSLHWSCHFFSNLCHSFCEHLPFMEQVQVRLGASLISPRWPWWHFLLVHRQHSSFWLLLLISDSYCRMIQTDCSGLFRLSFTSCKIWIKSEWPISGPGNGSVWFFATHFILCITYPVWCDVTTSHVEKSAYHMP